MADAKTYLNVPYAEKDAAKALGARWDAANKKWYVPANKDITLFGKWQTDAVVSVAPSNSALKPAAQKSSGNGEVGGITRSSDKNFVAYDGDQPPWD